MAVVIETTIGDFTVDLYIDERPQSKSKFCSSYDRKNLYFTYLSLVYKLDCNI